MLIYEALSRMCQLMDAMIFIIRYDPVQNWLRYVSMAYSNNLLRQQILFREYVNYASGMPII
jgi:uncharacterized protein Veg